MKTSTLFSIATATILLTACGGGGDTSATTPPAGETSVSLCVPVVVDPQYTTCAPECATDEVSVNSFSNEQECDVAGTAWLASLDQDDTPSTQPQIDALAWLNEVRAGVGLPLYKGNAQLEEATKNHEWYFGDVYDTYNVPHWEITHWEYNDTYPSQYYTGVYASDRAKYAGYAGDYAYDEITFGVEMSPYYSLRSLFTMIYHRLGFLSLDVNEIGIGGTPNSFNTKAQAHLIGERYDRSPYLRAIAVKVAKYPYNGQTNVRRSFNNREIPDPLPSITAYTGNPISVEFNWDKSGEIELASFKLFYDSNNTEITNTRLLDANNDPANILNGYQFVLFPLDVLDANTTYRVEFNYKENGVLKSEAWRFTTGQD